MSDYYTDALLKLVEQKLIHRDMRVLVLCGGRRDQEALTAAGFKNVTISNLDSRMDGNAYAPFAWSFQDAENLTYADGEFDFCVAHDGLHHCHSPHRALLEIYRVARTGLLVFDPRDNFITRLGVRCHFGQEYEVAAVVGSDWVFGGVKNTEIPNFVYRWTEREIKKAIACNAPWGRHRFLFFYNFRVPWARLKGKRNKLPYLLVLLGYPLLWLFLFLFRGQRNTFGFAVFKPEIPGGLHPWIQSNGERFALNKTWVEEHCR